MKQIRLLLFVCGCLSAFTLKAQDDTKVPVVSRVRLGVGHIDTRDSYLSPQVYDGTHWLLQEDRFRNKLFDHPDLVGFRSLSFSAAKVYNEVNSWSKFQGELMGAYQVLYRKRAIDGLFLFGGGGLRAALGGSYDMSGSNNPGNAKLDLNAIATLGSSYYGRFCRVPFAIHYQATAPLLGLFFTPNYGQSYYEIFQLGNYKGTLPFASWHNQQAIFQSFRLELPIGTHAVSVGFDHSYYATNQYLLKYQKSVWQATIGYTVYMQRLKPFNHK